MYVIWNAGVWTSLLTVDQPQCRVAYPGYLCINGPHCGAWGLSNIFLRYFGATAAIAWLGITYDDKLKLFGVNW